MVKDLVLGGIYQHYKGMNYMVLDVAKHSETLEEVVVYKCLYPNPEGLLWVRPLKMFLEDVDVEGSRRPRFNYIGDKKGKERL